MARSAASTRINPTYLRMSMGGVYIPGAKSIEGATGDSARTTDGYIENEKYHWYMYRTATAVSSEFDTAITRTEAKTFKLSTTNTTGRVSAYAPGIPNNVSTLAIHGSKIKPSTNYVFNCYVKTDNVATNSVYVEIEQYNSVGTYITISNSNKLSGTNDWTLLTISFTSNVNAYFFRFIFHNIVAGNVSDAWFDVNGMTLTETGVLRSAAAARNPVV